VPAWIGLGSNLDDPEAKIRWALGELGRLPGTRLHCHSRLYRNPPMGPPDQPDFVNAAGTMAVSLSQHAATTSAARTAPANEVICVLDGSLTLTHGETQEVHAKGAAVYLPQGCVTGWQTDEGTRLLISRASL